MLDEEQAKTFNLIKTLRERADIDSSISYYFHFHSDLL